MCYVQKHEFIHAITVAYYKNFILNEAEQYIWLDMTGHY